MPAVARIRAFAPRADIDDDHGGAPLWAACMPRWEAQCWQCSMPTYVGACPCMSAVYASQSRRCMDGCPWMCAFEGEACMGAPPRMFCP
eukprot:351813-Chlamydomonas_euryale.AAC.2